MKKQITTMKREFSLPQKWLKTTLLLCVVIVTQFAYGQSPSNPIVIVPTADAWNYQTYNFNQGSEIWFKTTATNEHLIFSFLFPSNNVNVDIVKFYKNNTNNLIKTDTCKDSTVIKLESLTVNDVIYISCKKKTNSSSNSFILSVLSTNVVYAGDKSCDLIWNGDFSLGLSISAAAPDPNIPYVWSPFFQDRIYGWECAWGSPHVRAWPASPGWQTVGHMGDNTDGRGAYMFHDDDQGAGVNNKNQGEGIYQKLNYGGTKHDCQYTLSYDFVGESNPYYGQNTKILVVLNNNSNWKGIALNYGENPVTYFGSESQVIENYDFTRGVPNSAGVGVSAYQIESRTITFTSTYNSPKICIYIIENGGVVGWSAILLKNVKLVPVDKITIAQPTYNPSYICVGDQVRLSVNSNWGCADFEKYTWGTNPNIVSTDYLDNDIYVTPTQTTTYSVTATDSYQCSDSKDVVVPVTPSTVTTIGASPWTICPGETVTFTSSGTCKTGFAAETWNFGDGTPVYTKTAAPWLTPVTHVFANPGTFNVTCTITDIAGHAITWPYPTTITVDSPPAPAIVTGYNNTCAANTISYTVSNLQPNTTYSWAIPPGSGTLSSAIGNSTNITWNTASMFQSTPYTITVTGTSNFPQACKSTGTYDVFKCCANTGTVYTNATFSAPLTYTSNFSVQGDLTINANVTFSGITVSLSANSRIIVKPGYTLTIVNSTLQELVGLAKCSYMWDGIYVTGTTSKVTIRGSYIKHAKNAVVSDNRGYYEILNSYFYDNYIGMIVKNWAYTPINPTAFTGTVINTVFSTQTGLIAPRAGELCYIGIDARDMYGLTIGADAATSTNTFNNLFCGIRGTDAHVTVKNCKFTNMVTTGIGNPVTYGDYNSLFNKTAIHLTRARSNNASYPSVLTINSTTYPSQFTNCTKSIYTYKANTYIDNNAFSSSLEPILIIDPPTSGCTIVKNTIANGSANAIFVKNINPAYVKLTITNNTITTPTARGIWLLNCNAVSNSPTVKIGVVDNNITFASTTASIRTGIQTQNCNNIEVKCNEVSNTAYCTANAKLRGISVENCLGSSIYNNDNLRNLDIAIRGAGDLSTSSFTSNSMFSSYYGIYFEPGVTTITLQGSSLLATDNNWNSMDVTRRIGGGVAQAGVIWYTRPGLANASNIYWTGIVPGHPLNTLIIPQTCITGFTSNTMTCTTGTGGGGGGTFSIAAKQQQLEPIASDQMSYTALEPELKEYDKTYAYSEIVRNPVLTQTGNSNAALLTNFADYIKNTNIGTFESINQLIENSNIETAILKNATVIAQQLTETNKKYVNEVYLNKVCKKAILSETEKAALTDIALLTPFIGGNAVYTARAIMGIDPEASSLTFGSIGQISQIDSDSTLTCKIYPNPASNEVSIEISHSEKPVLVRIVNMLGVEVVKRNITLSNGAAKLDVSALSNGMYYIVVYINNEIVEQQRLVISK